MGGKSPNLVTLDTKSPNGPIAKLQKPEIQTAATSDSLTTPFENPKLEPTSPAVEDHKTKTKTKNFRTFKMSKKRVRKFQHFQDEQKTGTKISASPRPNLGRQKNGI
jgi:hypothetical protein